MFSGNNAYIQYSMVTAAWTVTRNEGAGGTCLRVVPEAYHGSPGENIGKPPASAILACSPILASETMEQSISNGNCTCISCWDSHPDPDKDNDMISKGAPVYWQLVNIEYDEWNAYCEKHAKEQPDWNET